MKNRTRRLLSGADRMRRRAGLDRNPMRRREDHVQTAVTWALVSVFLVAATIGTYSAGSDVYRSGLRIEQSQSMSLREVTAAVSPSASGLQVTWKGPDGTSHQAAYPTGRIAPGNTIRIWVDRSGKMVNAPRRHVQTIVNAILAGLGMFLAALAVLTSCLWASGNLLNRRRSRSWDLAWERADLRYGQPGHRPDQN